LNSTPTSTLSGGMETPAGPRRSRRRSAGAAGAGDSDDDEAIVLDSPSPSGERGANSDPLLSDVSASALKKKPAAELASRCVDLAKRCRRLREKCVAAEKNVARERERAREAADAAAARDLEREDVEELRRVPSRTGPHTTPFHKDFSTRRRLSPSLSSDESSMSSNN